MKNMTKIGSSLFISAAAVLFVAGMTGCGKGKQSAPEMKPTVDLKTDAAQPPVENPAAAKPKDHPAH